jgi:hypothetical protein
MANILKATPPELKRLFPTTFCLVSLVFISELLRVLIHIETPGGQVVMEQGGYGTHYFYIISGKVSCLIGSILLILG